MKRLLVVLGLVAAFFGVKAIVNSVAKPAEGVVVIETETPTATATATTCTVTATTETATETVVVEEVEEAPVYEPISIPVKTFKNERKAKRFADKIGGNVVIVDGQPVISIKVEGVGIVYYYVKDGKVVYRLKGKEYSI